MNLGVGMGDELASEGVVLEAIITCWGCCAAVMGTKTLLEAVVLLSDTKKMLHLQTVRYLIILKFAWLLGINCDYFYKIINFLLQKQQSNFIASK